MPGRFIATASLLISLVCVPDNTGASGRSTSRKGPGNIRVKARVQVWTSRGYVKDLSERTYVLSPGDSLPPPHRNLRSITLVRILSPTRGVFHIDTLEYHVTTPFNRQPTRGCYEVGDKGIAFDTNSEDGGWTVQLAIVR